MIIKISEFFKLDEVEFTEDELDAVLERKAGVEMKNFVAYFADALVIVTCSILFLLLPVYMLACIIIEYKWIAVLCIAAFLAVVTMVAFILKKKDKLRKEKERQALK